MSEADKLLDRGIARAFGGTSRALTLAGARPCPFCGGNKLEFSDIGGVSYLLVHCKRCGAEGPDENDEERGSSAVERWNKRI